ncbi:hypothetical protein D3C87_1855580 [compost metagenome]
MKQMIGEKSFRSGRCLLVVGPLYSFAIDLLIIQAVYIDTGFVSKFGMLLIDVFRTFVAKAFISHFCGKAADNFSVW